MVSANAMTVVGTLARQGLGAPLLLLVLLGMIVLPLPPLALDGLFTFNISLALIVMLVTIYSARPLDFAVFPTILLVATLLRLGLNIASTRVVLTQGHEGTAAAGRVIEAFGDVVIGGNYAVGLVVFAILVIINFVVVTKGATRVSEVSARFTLDAMPGKQMAIDADLNAGVIDQDEARQRRQEIMREADFYGAMDGASKFVRGDAIAAVLILFINILGGLAIGVLQHDLSLADAARNYVLLTIGDGLVAQVPALLLSTAAGIIVTRVSSEQDMAEAVLGQLFRTPQALGVTAGILGVMGLIPGMPHLAFLSLGGAAAWGALRISRRRRAESSPHPEPVSETAGPAPRELVWGDVAQVDRLGLEVGYRLIPLVDKDQNGDLLGRIKGVRKKVSQELGFLIPPVHVRDNLELAPNAYRIVLKGVPVAQGELQPERELAIDPGQVAGKLAGISVQDPVFGMQSVWIEPGQRQFAQSAGYTVVDAGTVVATHLNQVIVRHAPELLGHDEAQQLLDRLAEQAPKLVEDLVPEVVPRRTLVKVLQHLLADQIPIRDMQTILEAIAERAETAKDPESLTVAGRIALRRMIVQQIAGQTEELGVIALDRSLEQMLLQARQLGDGDTMTLEPLLAERIRDGLQRAKEERELAGEPPILLVPPALWWPMARFARRTVVGLHVLSYDEIPDGNRIRIVTSVGRELAQNAAQE
jgi:flagellar biosynthesis protein FlhA